MAQANLQVRKASKFQLIGWRFSSDISLSQARTRNFICASIWQRYDALDKHLQKQFSLLGDIWYLLHVLLPQTGKPTSMADQESYDHPGRNFHDFRSP